jgi:hypothetical protein
MEKIDLDFIARQSLDPLVSPEKPRNSAVFRGWLETLGWGQKLAIFL